MHKIFVTGSRDINDGIFVVNSFMNYIKQNNLTDFIVLHGNCKTGADHFIHLLCLEKDFKVQTYPANWKAYGKAAGLIRNREMATDCDSCIAFQKNMSKGTSNSILEVTKRGKKIEVINCDAA